MKQEKGVTLISVTIYVLVMLVVVSIISVITSFYYSNIVYVGADSYTHLTLPTNREV